MTIVAIATLAIVLGVTIWSVATAPNQAIEQFSGMWKTTPWGKQLFLDFYGLEAILALFILEDVSRGGSWTVAIVCIVTMPIFGASSAAAYWLLR